MRKPGRKPRRKNPFRRVSDEIEYTVEAKSPNPMLHGVYEVTPDLGKALKEVKRLSQGGIDARLKGRRKGPIVDMD